MQIKTITVRRAVKVNTGNFENTDFAIEMTMEVSPHEDAGIMTSNLASRVNRALREELVEFFSKGETRVAEAAADRALKKADRYLNGK